MKDHRGFTLIELMVVVAIFAVLVTIVITMTTRNLQSYRLSGASRELFADFQRIRMNALTTGSGAASRGFGIGFSSSTTYFTFEFNDANGNFIYNGTGEELNSEVKRLPTGVTIQRLSGGSLVDPNATINDIFFYDKRGMTRNTNWQASSGGTFVLQVSGVTPSKCVVISPVRIREGVWNDGACTLQ